MTVDVLSEQFDTDARSVANTFLTVLAIVALTLTAIVVSPGIVGADESYVVLSDSMEPAFTSGDIVVVRSVPPEQISVGDVVTYNSPGAETSARISHRVIAVDRSGDKTTFRTKGDQNEQRDQYVVKESDVIGQVWFVIPNVGYLVQFAGTTLGMLLLIVAPGILLVVTELWSVYQEATTNTEV